MISNINGDSFGGRDRLDFPRLTRVKFPKNSYQRCFVVVEEVIRRADSVRAFIVYIVGRGAVDDPVTLSATEHVFCTKTRVFPIVPNN